MSETTNPTEAPSTEVKTVSPELKAKIAPFAPMFAVFKTIAQAANDRAAKIKAATSDRSEAVDAVLSTSDDAKIVEWREWDSSIRAKIAEAEAKLAAGRETIKAHAVTLVPGVDAEFNVENEKKAFAEDRAKATAIRKSLLLILGEDEAALNAGMVEHGITEVVSFRGNSAGTAKGSTNIRRPRISEARVSVNGGEAVTVDDGKGKTSFTILTQYLSKNVGTVDGDTVRKAAFAAAKTEDLSTLASGTEIPFTLSINDKSVNVVVTAKGKDASEDSSETPEAPAEGSETEGSEGEGSDVPPAE